MLSVHDLEGFCTRCVAQVSLLGQAEPAELAAGQTGPFSPQRFGDYELLEEIARGGMGVVYKARQVSLNRVVAVKMILCGQFAGKELFQRFRLEAEAAARLQHPNIVAIHEIGEQDGQPYFSMDYVAGPNLAQINAERGARSAEFRQAAVWVRTIAEAVHHAHQHGILHRDLKPANLLVDPDGQVRITDFGLARRLDADSTLTLTGQALGSPNYMPPELAAGQHHRAKPASDVYSIGAILYELLTGRPPFLAQSVQETLIQIPELLT